MPIVIIGAGTTGSVVAPSLLAADPYDGAVLVTWTAQPNPGLTGFTVFVSLTNGTPVRSAAAGSTARSLMMSPLANGTSYVFSVVANTSAGSSVPSNALTAVPVSTGTDTPPPDVTPPPPVVRGQPRLEAFPAQRAFIPAYWLLTAAEADAL